MLLAVAGVAVGWHVGLWVLMFFGGVAIVCLVAQLATQHRIGNRALQAPQRWGLFGMMAYWLLLLVSTLYSNNMEVAGTLLILKGTLLVFPLTFLLLDTSWLKQRHLRAVGYALVLTMFGSFLYYCGVGVGKLLDGASMTKVTGMMFDPRHHAYTALYLDVALVFIYYELYTFWHELPRWWRVLLIVAVPLFIAYLLMVNSRAGMLVLYAAEVFAVLHFAFTRRRWGMAVLLAVLLGGYTVGMEHALPGHDARVAETLDDISADGRMRIYNADIKATMDSPIIGFGAGNYHDRLRQQYGANGWQKGEEHGYNAHNQYLETTLAIGFVGLAVLLFWLLWPLWLSWRGLRKGIVRGPVFWLILMLTFCVAFNFMFESMLERQMGLLFVGPLMTIMALIINVEKNKFGQLTKK